MVHMLVTNVTRDVVTTKISIVNTRGGKLPDPVHDPIQVVFWCLQTEDANIPSNGFQEGYHVGIIAVGDEINVSKIGLYSEFTSLYANAKLFTKNAFQQISTRHMLKTSMSFF